MDNKSSEGRKQIVIVDDNPVNLDMAESILRGEYKVTKLISGEQLMKLLNRVHPDMILLDIQMPKMDGYQVLKNLKTNPDWRDIPVIFITGQKDSASEREGFRLGAQDFIGKPFNNEVTLSRIRSQLELYQYRHDLESMVQEKTQRIETLQHVITTSWAEMVESRDGTTGSHVRNTAKYYDLLLEILEKDERFANSFKVEDRKDYVRASIIHDIGKIGIRDQVLKKPGPLTAEEFEQMKEHAKIGADMIQKIIDETDMHGFLQYAKELALSHHERWNGTGYPNGLKGNEIPVYVQALTFADVYDALTSVRPYKKAFSHEEAIGIMQKDRGSFYNPTLFDLFWDHHQALYEALQHKE